MRCVGVGDACLIARQHFAPIGQLLRVHGQPQLVHDGQIRLTEHFRHIRQLFHTHAMFAGDGAAHFDAEGQNFAGQLFGPLQLTRGAAIVQNQRMEITVAGMKDVGHR